MRLCHKQTLQYHEIVPISPLSFQNINGMKWLATKAPVISAHGYLLQLHKTNLVGLTNLVTEYYLGITKDMDSGDAWTTVP